MSSSPVATALLFFVLTSHALFVGATHSHNGLGPAASAFGEGLSGSVGERQDARESRKGGGHAQCLLCRLQRDLSSGVGPDTPRPAAPLAQSSLLKPDTETFSDSPDLKSPAGRGPPSASQP